MAAKRASTQAETPTARRSTRASGKAQNTTPIKKEQSTPAKSTGKRAAVHSGRQSKRVKVEKEEDVDVKPTIGLPSPSETNEDELSSDVSEVESSASEDEAPKSTKKRKATKSTKTSNTTKSPGTKTKTKSESSPDKTAALQARKLKAYTQFASSSPFPDFKHPTAEECHLAHTILQKIHGTKERPKELKAPSSRAGCGDSPAVLDALVRTILSQNTSDANSTRAKRSMDDVYGRSDDWEAIASGGREKLQKAIACGGLSQVKSKVIISILEQAKEKYGKYSLDHLFEASDEDAMKEMLSFQGVGPKTASCVLLFCLRRESFAVDTHVYRITGLLGWRPMSADREQAQAHLEVMVPKEDKYGLHVLLVTHGKRCDECKAGGRSVGKCALRRAFRKGKMEGKAGQDAKEEEMEGVKEELGTDDAQEAYMHGMQQAKQEDDSE